MRKINLLLLVFAVAVVFAQTAKDSASPEITIRAGTMLDGKGNELHNALIVIQDGKIVRVGQNFKSTLMPTYDLGRLTVMPGWIDVHDHITWHFGPNGRVEDKSETQEQAALSEA